MNTSDMHPFIHPLSAAIDPAWESRSDWEIYKGIAKRFSEMAVGHLGVEQDFVTTPLLHDTAGELAQPFGGTDWKTSRCGTDPWPRTARTCAVVERDYPNVFKKFTSLGPLLDKNGNGGKGINWNTQHEVDFLGELNHKVRDEGVSKGRPKSTAAIDAAGSDSVPGSRNQRPRGGQGVGGTLRVHRP